MELEISLHRCFGVKIKIKSVILQLIEAQIAKFCLFLNNISPESNLHEKIFTPDTFSNFDRLQ